MCIQIARKVVRLHGTVASMDDGREVRIGMISDVSVGDYLEVYGDIALSKIDKTEFDQTHTTNGKNKGD